MQHLPKQQNNRTKEECEVAPTHHCSNEPTQTVVGGLASHSPRLLVHFCHGYLHGSVVLCVNYATSTGAGDKTNRLRKSVKSFHLETVRIPMMKNTYHFLGMYKSMKSPASFCILDPDKKRTLTMKRNATIRIISMYNLQIMKTFVYIKNIFSNHQYTSGLSHHF